MGSNPAQSLKIFSGLCSSSVTAALALMTVITQLLLWDKLLSCSLLSKNPNALFPPNPSIVILLQKKKTVLKV